MSEKKFNNVILDIDGTIWNTTGVVADAWNKAIEQSGFCVQKVNAKMLEKQFGKTMDSIAQDLWKDLNLENRKILMESCCNFEQIEIKENTKNLCYPFVVEEIKALSKNVNFYIVSNCQKGYIELTLEKTGLTPFVKDWECFGNTEKSKGENIKLLVERNKLQNVMYVGDTQGDMEACQEANVPFVWASYGFGFAQNYFAKIDSFSQLKNIVL